MDSIDFLPVGVLVQNYYRQAPWAVAGLCLPLPEDVAALLDELEQLRQQRDSLAAALIDFLKLRDCNLDRLANGEGRDAALAYEYWYEDHEMLLRLAGLVLTDHDVTIRKPLLEALRSIHLWLLAIKESGGSRVSPA